MPAVSKIVLMAAAVAGTVSVIVVAWRFIEPTRPGTETTASVIAAPVSTPASPPPGPALLSGSPPVSKPADPEQPPKFDIVRVEPTGDAVIAGTAKPDSRVLILDDGRKVAETRADPSGSFAILPPALPPGDHVLTLSSESGAKPLESEQSVAVSIPAKAAGHVVTALQSPDQPTRILSQPGAAAPAPGPVTIRSVEAGGEGAFYASGTAPAGSAVRIYLNGSFIVDAHAGADGGWSLRVEKGMAAGHYDVRADLLDAHSGVAGRAEVPFDYPVQTVAAPATVPTSRQGSDAASALPTASPGDTAQVPGASVVADVTSVTVLRGDSLWRISRRILGRGVRYTQIYEANSGQIRDPNRIWPGQIFVAPGKAD